MLMMIPATLLLTSLSLIGLISLWAARSPIHWFFRAAVFVAVVSMLLLVPAYEPFVAFSVQGAVVAVYDTSSPAQLAKAVAAMTPVYERLDRGLQEAVHCPLEYHQSGDGYLLYSVGYNGIDDGGDPPAAEPFSYTGDLRLDVLYADL